MDEASSGQDGDPLKGMRRVGADGNVALIADDLPPREISPGRRPFKDLIPSLDPDPESTVVKGVKWLVPEKGVPGQLIFPSSFSGEIASAVATLDNVQRYGAKFANRTNGEIDVHMYHQQTSFTYAEDYLQNYVIAASGAGGASLERRPRYLGLGQVPGRGRDRN